MKKLIALMVIALLFALFTIPTAFAADTLLPNPTEDCELFMSAFETLSLEGQKEYMVNSEDRMNALGCSIKSGNIHLWMLPFYITHIIEFIIGIIGLVSVLFVMIGGYYYAWGGITEDKEKGKKTVIYALVGLALAAMAWIIVNIVQTQLTV